MTAPVTPMQVRTGIHADAAHVVVVEVQRHVMRNFNYLVVDRHRRDAVLVDPAWQFDKIQQAVSESGASLREVLITHSHPDHIDLARRVSDEYRCPIRMSKEEIAFSGFDAPRLEPLDGAWRSGGLHIRPILTPGHTPGCVCYLIDDNLFTGDVLFAEGCGMCPSREAAQQMYHSLAALKGGLDPRTRVYPGHSYGKPPGRPMAELLRDNMYLQFTTPDSFVAFRMRPGQGMAKLFNFR
jgi:hydroxyacylglutathione hydrolase